MSDQAKSLREQVSGLSRSCRSLAIVSGKGGVGKSNFSMNFALALAAGEKKVLLLDMDIGMGNIHILLGKSAEWNLQHYLEGQAETNQLIVEGPRGLHYISGGSGLSQLMEWTEVKFQKLMDAFEEFQGKYDFIVFDMSAGASAETIDLLMSIEDIFVLMTPEPTAITDAYSMMKFICLRDSKKKLSIICNRSDREDEGAEAAARLQAAVKKFLGKDVTVLGVLPEDQAVKAAVKLQRPFLLYYPRSKASKKLIAAAEMFLKEDIAMGGSKKSFTDTLKALFRKKRLQSL